MISFWETLGDERRPDLNVIDFCKELIDKYHIKPDDAHHRILTYTQAGHPEGFVLRQESNEIISLTSEGQLVGAFRNEFVNYTESKIQLKIGDKLILYTDAILEVRNSMDVMIKREAFTSFLINNSHRSISDLLNSVRAFGLNYSGKEFFNDDFTLLGFEVLD